MSVRVQQIEEELKNLHVSKDMYELWLENEVTRKFMLEMERAFLDVALSDSAGGSIEKIAIFEICRKSEKGVYEKVLEWEPDF